MPTFQTQITVDAEVEFEVFCACGNGMCNATETRESRSRRYESRPQGGGAGHGDVVLLTPNAGNERTPLAGGPLD